MKSAQRYIAIFVTIFSIGNYLIGQNTNFIIKYKDEANGMAKTVGIFEQATTNNVGINTTTPSSKLSINGGLAVGTYAGSNAAPTNGMIISGKIGIGTTSPLSLLSVNGGLAVGTYAGSYAAPTNGMIVSGKIGIGTTAPGTNEKLAIAISGTNNGVRIGPTVNDGSVALFVKAATASQNIVQFGSNDGLTSKIFIVNASGDVGIGTTNLGTNKLAVNGTIKTKEVNVTSAASDWPDYVFDETYKLPDLANVEQSIQTEKHLPGFPSKEEVAKDGVKIGEMQTKLLRKVEELTLYVIEQNKRIEKLEKENQKLKN